MRITSPTYIPFSKANNEQLAMLIHKAAILRSFHDEHSEDINQWLIENVHSAFSCILLLVEDGLSGELVRQFWFQDPEDCLLFKLVWC